MKVFVAIDSFKGSLNSITAGRAAVDGVRRVFPEAECVVRPLADGGEGTVDALVTGLGGTLKKVEVTGPAGKPTIATYGLLPSGVAIMEMAQAAGITLVSGVEKNPLHTTTYGVGEMILDAVRNGARKFVIGIGGSATNDGGAGMLQALGFRLLDAQGRDIPRGGAALAKLKTILPPAPSTFNLQPLTFRIACDVTNPLCGPLGTSAVFGPQKGATPEMVAELDAALSNFAEVQLKQSNNSNNQTIATFPGSGAAGGLGFAFKAFLNADLVPGVDLILTETGFEQLVREADVVITGEGRLDGQTVMGKAPIGVARLAKKYGKRVFAFSGCVGDGVEQVNAAGIDAFFPILQRVVTLDEALEAKIAAENLTATVEQVFRVLKGSICN